MLDVQLFRLLLERSLILSLCRLPQRGCLSVPHRLAASQSCRIDSVLMLSVTPVLVLIFPSVPTLVNHASPSPSG